MSLSEKEWKLVRKEGASWGSRHMLRAGVPIFYRDCQYPETKDGALFVKQYPNGAKFLVRKTLTDDYRLLEEEVKFLDKDVVDWLEEDD
jgi:hypothetical protein